MRTVIFRVMAPYLTSLMFLFSLFVLLRGHNEPGGGFIGGLIAASAIAVYGMAVGVESVRRALHFHPIAYAGFGLIMATLAGFASIFLGYPFMTGLWWFPQFLGEPRPGGNGGGGVDDDAGAGGRQPAGDGLADAAARSGDDDDVAGEVHRGLLGGRVLREVGSRVCDDGVLAACGRADPTASRAGMLALSTTNAEVRSAADGDRPVGCRVEGAGARPARDRDGAAASRPGRRPHAPAAGGGAGAVPRSAGGVGEHRRVGGGRTPSATRSTPSWRSSGASGTGPAPPSGWPPRPAPGSCATG